MIVDINSFDQNYNMNLRYEDFVDETYHLIKIGKADWNVLFSQLVSISSNPFVLLGANQRDIGGYVFVIARQGKVLFQIRKDGSKVQLPAFKNDQVPIEALLENYRNNIK